MMKQKQKDELGGFREYRGHGTVVDTIQWNRIQKGIESIKETYKKVGESLDTDYVKIDAIRTGLAKIQLLTLRRSLEALGEKVDE